MKVQVGRYLQTKPWKWLISAPHNTYWGYTDQNSTKQSQIQKSQVLYKLMHMHNEAWIVLVGFQIYWWFSAHFNMRIGAPGDDLASQVLTMQACMQIPSHFVESPIWWHMSISQLSRGKHRRSLELAGQKF